MLERRDFTFPFKDDDWSNKFLIGSLFHLIAPFLLYMPLILPRGYSLRVWRDAIDGLPPALGEWDDWEGLGLCGLGYYGIMLLCSLPAWLLWAVVMIFSVGGSALLVWVIESLESGGAPGIGQALAPLFMMGGIGAISLLALAVSLFVGFFYPLAVGRYLEQGRFGAAFEFGKLWPAARANLGGLAMAWLVVLGLNLIFVSIVSLLSMVLCCIPFVSYLLMAPVAFYISLVQARLMGNVYREAQCRLSDAQVDSKKISFSEQLLAASEPAEDITQAVAQESTEVSMGQPETKEGVSIERLELSTRVEKILRGAGLDTVDQLLERLTEGDKSLLAISGLGRRSLAEIKSRLESSGLLD